MQRCHHLRALADPGRDPLDRARTYVADGKDAATTCFQRAAGGNGQVTVWWDVPASYHNGAGGLSFADGHAEIKRWRDQGVLHLAGVPSGGLPRDPNSTDLSCSTTSRDSIRSLCSALGSEIVFDCSRSNAWS